MRGMMRILFVLAMMVLMGSPPVLAEEAMQDNNNGMIIRIAEIAVYPEYLDVYLSYAKEVAQQSVEDKEGVVAIYPMQVIGNDAQIRILEIYRNQAAYKKHIASLHFKNIRRERCIWSTRLIWWMPISFARKFLRGYLKRQGNFRLFKFC